MQLLGLPTSSRFRQLTGKDWRIWNSIFWESNFIIFTF